MRNNTTSENSRFYLMLTAMVLIGLGLRLCIAWQDFALLFQKCVVDDALFYLNIAKNISIGKGATFDGSVLTNGFHPVYALCLIPLFWIFPDNPDMTFHLGLTILSIFNVLTGVFIFSAVRELAGRFAGLFASFIWLFNPYVIFISLNGVEVSAACFFLSLSAYRFIVMRKTGKFDTKGLFILGGLTALAILSRIDSVFLLVTLTLFIFCEAYKKERKVIPSISRPVLFNLAAFTIMSPWFLWNLYNFGSIRQISGVALPNIAHNMYLMKYGTYFSLGFLKTELFYLAVWIKSIVTYSGGVVLLFFILLIFIWAARKDLSGNVKELLYKMRPVGFMVLSSIILVLFYALYFWGWHRPWYYLSVVLTMTICMGIIAGHVQGLLSSRVAGNGVRALLLAVLSFYFLFTGVKTWEKGLFPFQKELYDSAVWINENTDNNAKIGAISSGIYGYITHRTTDLLGVVNEEAYRAAREKRFFSYLKEKDLDYLVDREDMVRFFSERFDEEGFMDKLTVIKRFGERSDNVVVYKISAD